MGSNSHPAYNNPTFRIFARPEEHEAMIRRQGQYIRLIQAKKCPCIKNGKPSLYHARCGGKGYIYSFQETYRVLDENSPHCGGDTVRPFWTPIVEVEQVQVFRHPNCGSNALKEVLSFSDDQILLVDDGDFPAKYEHLRVTYSYSVAESVTNEDSTHDGTFYIQTTGTKIIDQEISNHFNIHGDISEVTRVYNKTQDYTYTVLSFKKQTIVLDPESGGAPVPGVNDVLEVDYKYIPPFHGAVGRVDTKNAMSKWGEDLKQGDIECTIPGGWHVKRGNIITLMATEIIESTIITRGDQLKDEIPQFDVIDILEKIEDEDGVLYTKDVNFKLVEYNDLVWITGAPAQGKKFTIVYKYRPSYIIYTKDNSQMNAENKRFPQNLFLRKFDKYNPKELQIL